MLKQVTTLALCALLTPQVCLASSSIGDQAEAWLEEKLDYSGDISVSLSKNKIRFNGCRQKDYKLSLATRISDTVNLEAVASYGRAVMDFGVFSQRVTSRAYELITWWEQPAYRVGVASGVRPAHDIDLPVSGSFALPDSNTVSVYLETEGAEENHTMSFAVRRETWHGDTSDITLSQDKSYDNQVQLGYRVSF
ncbi:MAG: hypothetical protein VYE47_08215 [Pseudomonadota bacterium]|nr:hypothetical protein [Pseudomonadota bacterium]